MDPAAADPTSLFDRCTWRAHRERAARAPIDFLHDEVAARLVDRLADIRRSFAAALDLGSHGGALTRALAACDRIERIVALDPAPRFLAGLAGERVVADPELIPFAPASFDLVLSPLLLHWVGDLPGSLIQLRRVLRPDGLLLAAMLGGRTLGELATVLLEAELAEEDGASPRVSPSIDLADAAHLLQRAGFALPVADAETITVSYPDALALMRDLRGMGESNALVARRRNFWRRQTLARAAALYAERFALPDGRITATFEILFLTGWAPHENQPQPLRPGSARQRLATSLGTVEHPAGDRAAPPRDERKAD
jgi:SAM-dependent methyltransferase